MGLLLHGSFFHIVKWISRFLILARRHRLFTVYLNQRFSLRSQQSLRQLGPVNQPFDDRNRFGVNGTAFELKYQLLNPFQDAFGFALYFEPGYNSIERADGGRHDEFELETKLILQKNFLDDRLIAAVNYTIEPEWVRSAGSDWATNLKMEWTAGLSWKFARHWWLGVETRLDTEFADADLNKSEFVTFSAGPTLHYGGERLFATLTVLPQIWGWPDQTGTGGRHLDDRERVEIRLKLGTEF